MDKEKILAVLTPYDFSILSKNSLISLICGRQLKTAKKRQEEVELSLTVRELEELIGYVAAECNHARTERQREDLGQICDYLESFGYRPHMP